jgi:hypothetical protein
VFHHVLPLPNGLQQCWSVLGVHRTSQVYTCSAVACAAPHAHMPLPPTHPCLSADPLSVTACACHRTTAGGTRMWPRKNQATPDPLRWRYSTLLLRLSFVCVARAYSFGPYSRMSSCPYGVVLDCPLPPRPVVSSDHPTIHPVISIGSRCEVVPRLVYTLAYILLRGCCLDHRCHRALLRIRSVHILHCRHCCYLPGPLLLLSSMSVRELAAITRWGTLGRGSVQVEGR